MSQPQEIKILEWLAGHPGGQAGARSAPGENLEHFGLAQRQNPYKTLVKSYAGARSAPAKI